MNCLLCHQHANPFLEKYFRCHHCDLVFKDPNNFLNADEEYGRYKFHHNDVFDEGYTKFLNKLIKPLEAKFDEVVCHLDFGSGVRSYFSEYFLKQGKKSEMYDLYFYPDKKILTNQFDLITCSEVAEHFKDPNSSWDELNKLLSDDGYLAVMTSFLKEEIDFEKWWYKNDPTHVVFYSLKTLNYIATRFNWDVFFHDDHSVIIFKKRGSNNV